MSMFDGTYNPTEWLLEKSLFALEGAAKIIDLANEPDTTKWYEKKLKQLGGEVVGRLIPIISLIHGAGQDAAAHEEWKEVKERGSFALAKWCSKWGVKNPYEFRNNVVAQDDSEADDNAKGEAIELEPISKEEKDAAFLQLEIHHMMWLAMLNDDLPVAAKRILAWCCFHLIASRYADTVIVSKKFLPTDIRCSEEETKAGYKALYENGLIERVLGIGTSDEALPIRLVVEGLNESKHPTPYRDEEFGADGLRIDGKATYENTCYVDLPPTYERVLRWTPLIQEKSTAELRHIIQEAIGRDHIWICKILCRNADTPSEKPALMVDYRIPISVTDTEPLDVAINNNVLEWLKRQTIVPKGVD